MEMLIQILLILGLFALNGVLAMSETAMVSSQKVRLRQRAEAGSAGARAALLLADRPTRFLSTIQIGITLIGILSGALGEASIASALEAKLATVGGLVRYADELSLAIVVVGLTLASLVIGELIPKRVALIAPEAIASALALPLRVLSRITAPAVGGLSLVTDLLLAPLLRRAPKSGGVTSEEINILVEEGARAGEFGAEEQRLIERVLHLGDQRIDGLMVHRTEMTWFDLGTPLDKARRIARGSALSHFPVCKGTVDRVVGVVSLRDLLPTDGPQQTDLRQILKTPVFVPDSAPALRVLDRCRQAQAPAAFVVDEYGAVLGEVSVERILDRLVGRVWSGEKAAAKPTP
jgi:putative hemolysin